MSIYSTSKEFYEEPMTSADYAEEMKAEYETLRFNKLKELLVNENKYVEDFLGYSIDCSKLTFAEIDELIDDARDKMTDIELEDYYKKFNINKILEEIQIQYLLN